MKTAIESYLNEIGKKDLLSREDENRLASIIQGDYPEANKQQAIERLVEGNLRLVVTIAFEFSKRANVDAEELIGPGNEGLMKAVAKFDPSQYDNKFSTYAAWWIKQKIKHHLYSFSDDVKINSDIVDLRKKYLEFKAKGFDDIQIKRKMGLSDSKLYKIKMACVRYTPLDCEISEDGTTFGETLEDDKSLIPSIEMSKIESKKELMDLIESLDDIAKDIIVSRFLKNKKDKLDTLGTKYNLSRERIRQIEKRALGELKEKLADKN